MANPSYGWTEPEYQDDVKNLKNEYSGRVIAVYKEATSSGLVTYLDVRCDDRVFYHTLATNWETTSKESERID